MLPKYLNPKLHMNHACIVVCLIFWSNLAHGLERAFWDLDTQNVFNGFGLELHGFRHDLWKGIRRRPFEDSLSIGGGLM